MFHEPRVVTRPCYIPGRYASPRPACIRLLLQLPPGLLVDEASGAVAPNESDALKIKYFTHPIHPYARDKKYVPQRRDTFQHLQEEQRRLVATLTAPPPTYKYMIYL